jgi:hypothetical protein
VSYELIRRLMSESKILEAVKLKRECSKVGGLTEAEIGSLRDVPTIDECIYPIFISPSNAVIGRMAYTIYDFLNSRDVSDLHILQESGLSSFDLKLAKEKLLRDRQSYDKLASYFLTIKGYEDAFSAEGTDKS